MAVARPKRLTTVVVDPQLVPIPVQPEDPEARPDAASMAEPLALGGEMLVDAAGFEEDEEAVAVVPRRLAGSR
jgi:hypothetical protein